jgi:hypothetical protein
MGFNLAFEGLILYFQPFGKVVGEGYIINHYNFYKSLAHGNRSVRVFY